MSNQLRSAALIAFSAWVLVCVYPRVGFSQDRGAIAGVVEDPTGAVVPNAEITLTHVPTGAPRVITSNSDGRFVADFLSIGEYRVEVSSKGFRKFVQTGVVLNVGDVLSLRIPLQVGDLTQSVTVTSEASMVRTETSDRSQLISGEQITELALNGRNFLGLATLGPGVASSLPDQLPIGIFFRGEDIYINGVPGGFAHWTLDGAENTNSGSNDVMKTFPAIDSIAEFRVLTNSYSAEYGVAPGGQISTVTKSGTNVFHGSAYEFLRNDALDARNFFAPDVTPLKQNNFGYTLGGPVRKTKDFFFWSQEWRRVRSASLLRAAVPDAAIRGGDFSGVSTPIIDPQTGLPFSGNIIPPNRIDPNATLLINSLYPLPNNPGGGFLNFIDSGSAPNNVRQELVRWDHHFNESHRLMVRYIQDKNDLLSLVTQWSASSVPTINTTMASPDKNFVARYTATINPTLLNEFAFTFSRQRVDVELQGNFAKPAGLTIPELFPENRVNRAPTILLGQGWASVSSNGFPWSVIANDMSFDEKLIKQWGNHSLKFGGLYLSNFRDESQFGPTQGDFTFSGQFTSHAVADFLLGRAASYTESDVQPIGRYVYNNVEAFVQDDWKASPRLTLNLGLRYINLLATTEGQDRMSNFVPALFDPTAVPVLDPVTAEILVPGDPLNGIVSAGKNGIPRGLRAGRLANTVAPRIGFAWDVFGTGKTAIRGGFGMGYYRPEGGRSVYEFMNNPPFISTVTVNTPLLSDPGAGTAPQFPSALKGAEKHIAPRLSQWSVGVQQEMSPNTLLEVSYVGSRAWTTPIVRDINQPPRSGAFDFDPLINSGTRSVDTFRPNIGYGAIRYATGPGKLWYDSLQIALRRRFTESLGFQVAYTWSKALAIGNLRQGAPEFAAGDAFFQDAYAPVSAEKSLTRWDRPHVLSINYIWELPLLKKRTDFVGKAFGGWELSGITAIQSGTPLAPLLATANAGLATRPNLVGDLGTNPERLDEWFNTAAFAAPAPGFFGNSGVKIIRGPGIFRMDLSVFKNHRIPWWNESANLQFRAEFFNIFNHASFQGVATSLGAPNFGDVVSARDPRIIQFGLKFLF